MHKYVKDVLMEHVKSKYKCPEEFTLRDLEELKMWGCAMASLLDVDVKYHSVEAMEDGENDDVEMSVDEFITRLKRMYDDSDTSQKAVIKAHINKIII